MGAYCACNVFGCDCDRCAACTAPRMSNTTKCADFDSHAALQLEALVDDISSRQCKNGGRVTATWVRAAEAEIARRHPTGTFNCDSYNEAAFFTASEIIDPTTGLPVPKGCPSFEEKPVACETQRDCNLSQPDTRCFQSSTSARQISSINGNIFQNGTNCRGQASVTATSSDSSVEVSERFSSRSRPWEMTQEDQDIWPSFVGGACLPLTDERCGVKKARSRCVLEPWGPNLGVRKALCVRRRLAKRLVRRRNYTFCDL